MALPRPAWVFPAGTAPPEFMPDQAVLVRQVMWSRRGRLGPDLEAFLHPDYDARPDAGSMKNMDRAVELVLDALDKGERIAIFGDYDADGVTATAILNRG